MTTTEIAPQTVEEALATVNARDNFEGWLEANDYAEYVDLYFVQKRAFELDGDDDFEDLGPLLTFPQYIARCEDEYEFDGEMA